MFSYFKALLGYFRRERQKAFIHEKLDIRS
jgi:hypothetical protein